MVLAGPIWNSFMNYALPKFPKENFKEPLPENKEKQRLMLDGVEPKEPHSILHFVNKKDPLAGAPENPEKDQLYYHFEYGIMSYLGLPLTTSAREFLNKF